MKNKPYFIRVSSQKGGVGKTVIAVNIATALRLADYNVLLIDGDFTNPSVGFDLGLESVNQGYIDVATTKLSPKSVIITHAPTGLRVLPGRINLNDDMPTGKRLEEIMEILANEDYDFIVEDTSPGFAITNRDYLKRFDEAIIITTPEMSSCTSAIRMARIYDTLGVKHSLIVNRVRNKSYEVSMQEIEEVYQGVITGTVPEDESVPLSVAERIPAYLVNERSRFSTHIARISKRYAARVSSNYAASIRSMGIIERILAALGIRRKNRIAKSMRE